jgi:tRNA dimethylallyltransferase
MSYLDGEFSLKDCIELVKKRSRNYAKRQVTFFKHQFDCETYNSIQEAKEAIIHG